MKKLSTIAAQQVYDALKRKTGNQPFVIAGYRCMLNGILRQEPTAEMVKNLDPENLRLLEQIDAAKKTGQSFDWAAIVEAMQKEHDLTLLLEGIKDSSKTNDPIFIDLLAGIIFDGNRRMVAYYLLDQMGEKGFSTIPVVYFNPTELIFRQRGYLLLRLHVRDRKPWDNRPQFVHIQTMVDDCPKREKTALIETVAKQIGVSANTLRNRLDRVTFLKRCEDECDAPLNNKSWAAAGRIQNSNTYKTKIAANPNGRDFQDMATALTSEAKPFEWTGEWNGSTVDAIFGNAKLRKEFLTNGMSAIAPFLPKKATDLEKTLKQFKVAAELCDFDVDTQEAVLSDETMRLDAVQILSTLLRNGNRLMAVLATPPMATGAGA